MNDAPAVAGAVTVVLNVLLFGVLILALSVPVQACPLLKVMNVPALLKISVTCVPICRGAPAEMPMQSIDVPVE